MTTTTLAVRDPGPALPLLSLGAGVQSTTVLLLACEGEIPRFDVALFADTGWEPSAVYANPPSRQTRQRTSMEEDGDPDGCSPLSCRSGEPVSAAMIGYLLSVVTANIASVHWPPLVVCGLVMPGPVAVQTSVGRGAPGRRNDMLAGLADPTRRWGGTTSGVLVSLGSARTRNVRPWSSVSTFRRRMGTFVRLSG